MLTVGQAVRMLGVALDHEAKVIEVQDGGNYLVEFTKYPAGYTCPEGHRPIFGPLAEDQLLINS